MNPRPRPCGFSVSYSYYLEFIDVPLLYVKDFCNRPNLTKCPPKEAIKTSVRVREFPPPVITLGVDIEIICSKIP